MKTKVINELDYCRVVSIKKMEGSGLKVGDILMVIGTKSAQEKANDPYLKRTYVMTIKVKEGVHLMPTSDPDDPNKAILMDPRKLEVVCPTLSKSLRGKLEEQFS